MSCVGVLSRLHNSVGNLATYICLRQLFVAISFERCRYFLAHVACRNLPWQGLMIIERWEMFIHAFRGGRINDYNAAAARNYAASSNEMNALLSGSKGKIPSVTIVFHFV